MTELCSICHNNIEKNKNIVITECSHTFHFSCLLKNIKQNISTGNQCPLCRFNFIKSIKPPGNFIIPSNFTSSGNFGSYTFINRRVDRPVISSVIRPTVRHTMRPTVRHTIRPTFRPTMRPTVRPAMRPTFRPAIRPTVRPSLNSIIPSRRVRRSGKRKQIMDRIEKLTYNQLKKKLKEFNLSTKGYMRTSFEKRLIDHLIVLNE